MQVSYDFLIGTTPLKIEGVGAIKSPKLKSFMCDEDGMMSYDVYKIFLSTILMDAKSFFMIFGEKDKDWWNEQSDEFKGNQNIVNLIYTSENAKQAYQEAFDFFFVDKVKYSEEHNLFLTYNGSTDENGDLINTGFIPHEFFKEICGIIAQFNGVANDETIGDSKPKYKNKLAEELMNRMKKGQEDLKKAKKEDKRYSLPNIISAVVSRHNSLNYTNIYELTVTQLYDVFNRLRNNSVLDISSISVAVWGDEKNKFDYDSWFKILNN